jgi:anti-anti-sigma factor
MDIQVRVEQGITVVALTGDLNAKTSPDVLSRILELAQPDCKVLLDLTGVRLIASAGARMLVQVSRTASRRNGRAVLVGLSSDIKNTLTNIDFLRHFVHRDTLADGLAALSA